MTIASNRPLIESYASAGVVTDDILSVGWNVLELGEINVFINSVDTPLIRGTDYDLILIPPEFQTANVKVLAPMAAALNGTDPIVIRNALDFRQGYDASALQDLPPIGLEVVLDRITLYTRELQQNLIDAIKFAPGSGIVWGGYFPDPVAEKFIRFSDDGLTLVADVDGASLAAAEANADRAEAAAARYLGPSATEPTTRIDLSALQIGDLYFDTVANRFKVWNGSAWITAVDSSSAIDIVGMAAIGTLAIGDLFPVYDLNLTGNRKLTTQKLWDSISTLTALGDAPAVGDRLPIRDISAGDAKTITITNLYKAIVNLTAVTAPVLADELALYDLSATAPRKLALTNLLKIINLLTADGTPDLAADYVATFDASTGLPKRVLLNLLGGAVTLIATTTVSGTPATVDWTGLGAYRNLWLISAGVSGDGSNPGPILRVSNDGGSSFISTGYKSAAKSNSGVANSTSALILDRSNHASSDSFDGLTHIANFNGVRAGMHGGITASTACYDHTGTTPASGGFDALRFMFDVGNLDAGTFYLLGEI